MISPPQSVEQLCNAARDFSPADRAAFLDRACQDSPELIQLVEERLLAEELGGGATLDWGDPALPASRSPVASRTDLPSAGRFAPGQVIAGRFKVIRYIARGGMGEVYEAEDRFLQGVHVALKMILPEITSDTGSARRFEQEVLLARKVIHANLCPIYDIARCDDPAPPFLFLTMKLLAGETLSSRLRRAGPIAREEVVAIFRQMVAGVAAIHAAGVIHRDIKPNNVMLDYSGPELCVSIMDFGLARLHETETTMAAGSLVAGTPGYMAPEILQGQGPSQATDIFALGVLLHQVVTGERPGFGAMGLTVEPSAALDGADVPRALVRAVKEFLSNDPKRRCVAFEQMQIDLATNRSGGAWTSTGTFVSDRGMSRRRFALGSAAAACVAAGAVAWKWDSPHDLPLPAKRFVALLNWPPPDAEIKPVLLGVIDAIGNELARAEAFDHNLLVIAPQRTDSNLTTTAQLNEARESLGANLVLAASGGRQANELSLSLRVLDPSASRPLRAREIRVPFDQQETLPEKAVRAAAELLDITLYKPDDQRSKVGTDSPAAYAAFQAAEALMKQENDSGLDAAIEQYKRAVEIDPQYAKAQAKLAWAYLRMYGMRADPGALALARGNCESAIQLDPNLVDAHLGLALALQETGDDQGAAQEVSKALALDPADPRTLIYQAKFYAADNRWEEAGQTFDRVFKLRPNFWLAHNEWGVILDYQGRYAQALVEFRSASVAAPKNALALKNVGSVYLQLGTLPEALASLNASFNLKQDDQTAEALAEVFRIQHRYAEALDYAQSAAKMNPNIPSHWVELGDVDSTSGRYAEANAAYKQAAATQEEALQTSPKDGPGWMMLALCRAKTGQAKIAPDLIDKAESLHADDMDSQLYKARTLELAGLREDALSAIARCLSRGATRFQFESMPDLERLRESKKYESMVASIRPMNSV